MRSFLKRIVSEGRLIKIKYQLSESAQLIISEGSPFKISIVGNGPIDISRRVVY